MTAVEQPEVVVSKVPGTDGQVRTGALLSREKNIMRVRWDDDGSEVEVRMSPTTTFAIRGSVRHQGWVDGPGLTTRLEQDPVSVFVQLLRESATSLNAPRIKEKFNELAVDTKVVDRAWGQAQAKLRKLPEVLYTEKNRSYAWKGAKPKEKPADSKPDPETTSNAEPIDPERTDPAGFAAPPEEGPQPSASEPECSAAELTQTPGVAEPSAAVQEPETAAVTESAEPTLPEPAPPEPTDTTGGEPPEAEPDREAEQVDALAAGSPVAPVADVDDDQVPEAPKTAAEEVPEAAHVGSVAKARTADHAEPSNHLEQEASAEAPPAEPVRLPLAQALAAALGGGPAFDARAYARSVLTTAVQLADLSDSDLEHVLTSVVDEECPQAVALLTALPRKAKPLTTERLATVQAGAIPPLLAASVVELRQRPAAGHKAVAAAGWLLRRIADLPLVPQAVAAFITLAGEVATRDEAKEQEEALDRAALALGAWLPSLEPDERAVIDPHTVARLAAALPFTKRGGRAALLAAVARVWPERITEPMWWREVTLTALIDCSGGPLGRVTSIPEVSRELIAPLMEREIAKTTSRVRLATLLALPHEFVVHLHADDVATAFRRTALEDPVVGSWVNALSRAEEVAKLRGDIERAEAETRRADDRAEQADARGRELAARCEHLERLLRQQHERSVGMRAAQERQVQIDVIRALADLAAEVEELTMSKAAPEILMERVRALVADQELEAIGEAGAETSFDPMSHEILVGIARPGDAVSVLRPGYRWVSGGERTLLCRALVSPPQT